MTVLDFLVCAQGPYPYQVLIFCSPIMSLYSHVLIAILFGQCLNESISKSFLSCSDAFTEYKPRNTHFQVTGNSTIALKPILKLRFQIFSHLTRIVSVVVCPLHEGNGTPKTDPIVIEQSLCYLWCLNYSKKFYQEATNYCLERDNTVYTCLLDASKAPARVDVVRQ